jgi:hypothetical protein
MGDEDKISRLEIIPIREVFKNESIHFTRWLEEHIDILAERLDMQLALVQREKLVGDFSVDLFCERQDGSTVIIENQLEKTNHDHLGKVLTYMVNLDASVAIWIATELRPEHERVINWLNESTPLDISFYLVKVEAVRIGQSPYAPLFTVMAGPDRQIKEIGESKKERSEQHEKYLHFWKDLLERSKAKTQLFANIEPRPDSWISTGAGKSGVSFVYAIQLKGAYVELYIDFDRETGEKNKIIFDKLHLEKANIENDFGGNLDWERLDDKRASVIRKRFSIGGIATPQLWPKLHDEMIDAMIRIEKAIRPRLSRINI